MNIQDAEAKIGAIAGLYQMFLEGDPSRIRDVLADDYEQLPPQSPDTQPGVDNFLQAWMQGFASQFSEVTGEVTRYYAAG